MKPKPRPGLVCRVGGAFQPGKREFNITCHVWSLNGMIGRMNGIEGAPNITVKDDIAEYVKNILRGRKAWGLKHFLQKEWAKLPQGELVLDKEAAMPRAAGHKRARAGWRKSGEGAPSMGSLE